MRQIAILSAATLLSGCSSDTLTSPRSDAPTLEAVRASSLPAARPWRGKCSVDAQFVSATTLHITGSCELAHLGRATLVAIQTITPGPAGIAFENTSTYTASNGDELHTINSGTALPTADGLSLNGVETAVGGTGRFTTVSGTAALVGAVSFTSASTTAGFYGVEGSLSY